jgi:hypothetical protein
VLHSNAFAITATDSSVNSLFYSTSATTIVEVSTVAQSNPRNALQQQQQQQQQHTRKFNATRSGSCCCSLVISDGNCSPSTTVRGRLILGCEVGARQQRRATTEEGSNNKQGNVPMTQNDCASNKYAVAETGRHEANLILVGVAVTFEPLTLAPRVRLPDGELLFLGGLLLICFLDACFCLSCPMPAWLLPHRPSLPFAVAAVVDPACLPMLVYLLPTLTVLSTSSLTLDVACPVYVLWLHARLLPLSPPPIQSTCRPTPTARRHSCYLD